MTDLTILAELRDGVSVITLNRPDVLNSFNRRMAEELLAALEHARHDDAVRAVMLTGSGRGFCAGQDLSEVPPPQEGEVLDLGVTVRECYNPIVMAIRSLEKPVVAAVNGVAAGAGANLAFACDIVFASEEASFIQSFSRIGLVPDTGGTYTLPRLIGFARATALMMLAEKVSAAQAKAMGLIWEVTPGAALRDAAFAVASNLAKMPTRGLGYIKRALNASLENSLEEQLAMEEAMQRAAGETADFREGVMAFLEKRKPVFRGH